MATSNYILETGIQRSVLSDQYGDKGNGVILLAPSRNSVPSKFRNVTCCSFLYSSLIGEMQRLRGKVYLQDGAITREDVTVDNRHMLPVDFDSWQLLKFGQEQTVSGCLRYTPRTLSAKFEDFWIADAAIASDPVWAEYVKHGVAAEIEKTSSMNKGYCEVGGWAVETRRRFSGDALSMVLQLYGLANALGSRAGVTTATTRHNSASILKKLGARSIDSGNGPVPAYYDPKFGCTMELLTLEFDKPLQKYGGWAYSCCQSILDAPVVCPAKFKN